MTPDYELAGVTPITRRRDQLEASILAALTTTGTAHVDGSEVEVEEWRRTARRVARGLGRPVRTIHWPPGHAQAQLADWPATPDEEQVHLARMRAMMEAVSAALYDGPALRPVD